MRSTVRVEGLRELDAALNELGSKALAKGVLRRVGIKALQPFDARWRSLAPDDPATSGRDLKASGGVGTKLTTRQARLAKKEEGKAFVTVYAGPNDVAAVPQEFGTVDLSPQPFVRPAWADTKDEALEVVKRDLWGEIKATAARRAKRLAKAAAKAGS